jgi:hypothetical protein
MATSLSLDFLAGEEKNISFTYPYANAGATAVGAKVKTLMETIIDNADIFSEPPVSIKAAQFIDRTVTPISLD